MTRHLSIAMGILVLSGVAAVTSNSLRAKPLPWKREPLPSEQATATVVQPTSQSASSPTSQPVQAAAKPGVIAIDAVLAHLKAEDATFVDARETHEYVEGHFRVAIHLPSSDIYKSIEQKGFLAMVPTDSPVVVYCGGGDCEASHNVADALRRDFAYKNVLVYEKGWAEVMQSGRFSDHIEKGTPP
jgi:rhodanese-related sulfurtransferase